MLFYSPAQRCLYALAPILSSQSQAFRIAANPKWMRRRIRWSKFAAKARIRKSKICSATKTDFASAPQKSGSRSVLRAPALNLTILKPRSSVRKRSRPRFKIFSQQFKFSPASRTDAFYLSSFSCARQPIELLLARWNFKISSPNTARN